MITIPYDMTGTHIPVLAGELVEVTDPQPGETVIDMTFGAGGHARLFADRIGPSAPLNLTGRAVRLTDLGFPHASPIVDRATRGGAAR